MAIGQKYYRITDWFRTCNQDKVMLTFKQLNEITPLPNSAYYNGPPVKTTREKIIVNQIIPYQPILSPEPPCYRSAQRNCPAEQGCLDRLGLAGTMALARCPQLLNPLRTLAAAAQPARTRLSRSVACDAKQLW